MQRLGEVIGKGGWGTVYQGWNQVTGDFVAIKEVALQQIPKEQLNGFMVCPLATFFTGVLFFAVRDYTVANFKSPKNCAIHRLLKNRRLSVYCVRVCTSYHHVFLFNALKIRREWLIRIHYQEVWKVS